LQGVIGYEKIIGDRVVVIVTVVIAEGIARWVEDIEESS